MQQIQWFAAEVGIPLGLYRVVQGWNRVLTCGQHPRLVSVITPPLFSSRLGCEHTQGSGHKLSTVTATRLPLDRCELGEKHVAAAFAVTQS